MRTYTIACIGGHLSPALAVIEKMQKLKKNWKIIFFGRMHAQENGKDTSYEYTVMRQLNIPFFPITASRLNRFFSLRSLLFLIRFPVGIVQAMYYCAKEQPDVVMSFGGYVALPVSLAAWLLGIPVITHEQTSVMGLTNKIIAQFATKVLITFVDTKGSAKNTETKVVGLPIRETLFHPKRKLSFEMPKDLPIVFITGGTTGSLSINDAVFPIVEKLLEDAIVIHQTGKHSWDQAQEVRNVLSESLQKRYIIQQNFSSDDMAHILGMSTLIVGRSGANIVMEILTFDKQAIFIPLPWSGNGEQYENALRAKKTGVREILLQHTITSSSLFEHIHAFLSKKNSYHSQPQEEGHAADAIIHEIEKLLP